MTKDSEHLQWLHDRFIHVYGENKNVDFLIRMREIIESKKPKVTSTFNERDFNYYFDVGTEVMLDEETLPAEGVVTFNPIKLREFIGKKGIVKSVNSDLHAFAHGTSYNMDIEFEGELVRHIFAPHIIEYKEDE